MCHTCRRVIVALQEPRLLAGPSKPLISCCRNYSSRLVYLVALFLVEYPIFLPSMLPLQWAGVAGPGLTAVRLR